MTSTQTLWTLSCVLIIAIGQLLFKAIGLAGAAAGTFWQARSLTLGLLAAACYGGATLAWVWLLQSVPLTRAYPYMALSFVLVPPLSVLAFGERLSMQYLLGMALVIIGLVILGTDAR